jgi:uroporphyrinogen decarboxylase
MSAMTPRERVLAAIRHRLPDRIPVDAICVENVPAIADHLRIGPDAVIGRLGLDGRVVAAPCTLPVSYSPEGEALTEWKAAAVTDYGTSHRYPLASATSVAEVERYPWPSPDAYDYETAAHVSEDLGRVYAVRGPYWKPILCQACSLFGMETALERMLNEPAIFEAALECITVHTLEYCERLLDACGDGMAIFCLGDDFATQRGLLFNPRHWRALLKPRYARLFDLGKRRGKPVWFHSCGDITPVLPDLIEIGMDVWETVQLHTLPMSATELKRRYGRDVAFFGGVNTQALPFSSPAQVEAETIRCIETLGEGGGYICGPDHHVKPDVSPENTLAIFDTATAFRKQGYTIA